MKPYFEGGGVVLYHGDCREIMPALEPVAHVICDPPYEIEAHTIGRRASRNGRGERQNRAVISAPLAFDAIDEALRSFCGIQFGRLSTRWALVFCQIEAATSWRAAMEAGGMRYVRTGAWVKPSPMPQLSGDRPGTGFEAIAICHAAGRMRWNGGGKGNVWTHASVKDASATGHPTPKPLTLMSELIASFTDANESVLDPFCGSGTTLVAAWRLGRLAIGCELSERYCEIAAKRIEAEQRQGRLFAGETAEQGSLLP